MGRRADLVSLWKDNELIVKLSKIPVDQSKLLNMQWTHNGAGESSDKMGESPGYDDDEVDATEVADGNDVKDEIQEQTYTQENFYEKIERIFQLTLRF